MSAIRLLCILVNICYALANTTVTDCPLQNPAVQRFREYLQINTSRSENLDKAVDFWRSQAEQVGLDFRVYEPAGEPICVLTWSGANQSLPSIMLNSHMDVVPADGALWSHPPFAAEVDDECNVIARGAQDDKDVGIQYVEAIRRLKQQNVTLQRTIHVTLMPDEETGGFKGMRKFVDTEEFKGLNVGFALDEGVTTPDDNLYAMYQDRRAWSMNFTVRGSGGHGFTMPEDVAIAKLQKLIDVILEFRKPLQDAVIGLSLLEYGPYTTINLNMINGGNAPNVIPNTFSLIADMRLGSTANATEMLTLVNSWATYAGNGTTLEFLRQEMESLPTPVDDSNLYWIAMKEAINDIGYNITPIICPATTDMLFVRQYGIPALGFAPKLYTTGKAHDVDEYLNANVFLRGIEIYEAILKKITNLPEPNC